MWEVLLCGDKRTKGRNGKKTLEASPITLQRKQFYFSSVFRQMETEEAAVATHYMSVSQTKHRLGPNKVPKQIFLV